MKLSKKANINYTLKKMVVEIVVYHLKSQIFMFLIVYLLIHLQEKST